MTLYLFRICKTLMNIVKITINISVTDSINIYLRPFPRIIWTTMFNTPRRHPIQEELIKVLVLASLSSLIYPYLIDVSRFVLTVGLWTCCCIWLLMGVI